MNILIIEDDVFLAKRITKMFESKIITNRVKMAHSFFAFLDELSIIKSYDIVLVDLKLSNDTQELLGYKIIQIIREKHLHIPIVVMSCFSEIDRLRMAFDYGASDYIIKPIRLQELEIRVFNWFRNYCLPHINPHEKTHLYNNLCYDIERNEFIFHDKLIPLTKTSKYILSIFFLHKEKLLSKDFLHEKIWGDICFGLDRSLRINIFRLKKTLSPFGIDTWIHNVRGEGYIFYKD